LRTPLVAFSSTIARPTRAVSTTIRPPARTFHEPLGALLTHLRRGSAALTVTPSPDLRSVHSYSCCAHHLTGMFLQVCRASRTAFTFFSPPSCMRARLVSISILVGGRPLRVLVRAHDYGSPRFDPLRARVCRGCCQTNACSCRLCLTRPVLLLPGQ
jgi:hypothetical protein